jgi:hypothetical protein
VAKSAESKTSTVVIGAASKASRAKLRTSKPVKKKKGARNDDSGDCAHRETAPTTVPPTTTMTPTRGPSPCTESGPNVVVNTWWTTYFRTFVLPSFKSCCDACWADLLCEGFDYGIRLRHVQRRCVSLWADV